MGRGRRDPTGGKALADRAEIRTLLIVDLVDSTSLVEQLGDRRAAEIMRAFDRSARDLLEEHGGREIDKTDGFLLLFDLPLPAFRYALALHAALDALSAEADMRVAVRAGIHMGEVRLHENTATDVARGAKPLEVEGLAKPIAARLMSLALAGQTLTNGVTVEVVRRAVVGEGHDDWIFRSHGAYQVKGVTEPMEVWEVGLPHSPLRAPLATGKAWPVRSPLPRRVAVVAGVLLGVILALFTLVYWFTASRETVAVYSFYALDHRDGGWDVLGEPVDLDDGFGPYVRLVEVTHRGGGVVRIAGITSTGHPREIFTAPPIEPEYHGPFHPLELADHEYVKEFIDGLTTLVQVRDDNGIIARIDYRNSNGDTRIIDAVTATDDGFTHRLTGQYGAEEPIPELTHDHDWASYEETVDAQGWRATLEGGVGHRHVYARDARHRITKRSVEDASGTAVRESFGFTRSGFLSPSGPRMSWAAHGMAAIATTWDDEENPFLPTSTTYLGLNGEPAPLEGHCASQTWRYDDAGRTIESACLDAEGEPLHVLDGCTAMRWQYAEGNRETRCTDLKGNAVAGPGGWASRAENADAEGRVIETVYRDAKGAPAADADGIHRAQWTRDSGGMITRYGPFTGIDDAPRQWGPDSWGVRLELGVRGEVNAEFNLGPDGRPLAGPAGTALRRLRFDDAGHVIAVREYDADGAELINSQGFHESRIDYDENGRATRLSWYDTQGNPTPQAQGASIAEIDHDSDGNVTSLSCFDEDKQPILCPWHGWTEVPDDEQQRAWCHRIEMTWGELQSETRTCIGVDGKPQPSAEGWTRIERIPDVGPTGKETRFLDDEGRPVDSVHGYATVIREHDGIGRERSVTWENAAGERVRHPTSGCFEIRNTYTTFTHTQHCLGRDGAPMLWADRGCMVTTMVRNAAREWIEARCEDGEGQLMQRPGQVALTKRRLGPRGEVLEHLNLGPDGKLSQEVENARTVYEVDPAGRPIELRQYLDSGELALAQTREYDSAGRTIQTRTVAGDGTLSPGQTYAEVRRTYDPQGRILTEAFFDVDGQPWTEAGRPHRIHISYDGRNETARFFDAHGRPATYDGCFVSEKTFDLRGHVVRDACGNADGDLMVVEKMAGAAEVLTERDRLGRETGRRFIGADGAAHVTPQGYHRFELVLNAVGLETELTFYGPDGELAVLRGPVGDGRDIRWAPGTWARRTHKYDAQWRPTEIRYFGADGSPALGSQGWSWNVIVHDIWGHPVRTAWFGVDGVPNADSHGCVARTRAFESDGTVISEACETGK